MSKFFEKLKNQTAEVFSNLGSDHSSSKSSKSNESSSTTSTPRAKETKKEKQTKSVPPPTPKPGEIAGTATYIEQPKGKSRKVDDAKQTAKKTRMALGGGLSDMEVVQITKVAKIYENLYGPGSCPVHFKTEVKKEKLLNYVQGYTPDDKYYVASRWYREVADAKGKFIREAKEIVNIICAFQMNKAKGIGVSFKGYPDDPENVICEEFKTWTVQKFANLGLETAKENIKPRISYIDDILCKEDLIDHPGSTDQNTLQKTFIKVRRVLNTTLQMVEVAIMDLGTSLDELLAYLEEFMSDSASLLWYSFREKPAHGTDDSDDDDDDRATDNAAQFHRDVLSNALFKVVFASRFKPGMPPVGTLVKHAVVKFSEKGTIMVHENYLHSPAGSANPMVEPTSLQLTKLFVGDQSGFDRNFRGNEVIAKLFLYGHALLCELAAVWNVLKQAKKCNQSVLQHPVAIIFFRDIIEFTSSLTEAMRSTLHKIAEITEARFEQLVEMNWATVLRCPWIGNYHLIPRLFVKVEQNATNIIKEVALCRGKASGPVISEGRSADLAEGKTATFVSAAEELTNWAGRSLGYCFNAQKELEKLKQNAEDVKKLQEEPQSSPPGALGFLSDMFGEKKEEKKEEKPKLGKGFKEYTLDIVTADKVGAGTDANVYVVLVGTKARTVKIALAEDESKSRFEQGQLDSYNIVVEGDIGEIVELVLGHDNKGGGSDWHVQEARLADISTQNTYSFPCDKNIGGAFHKCEATFQPDKNQ